ncbi:hypothetical protein MMC25_001686 [Agyrium rufum]|nr:hypothetical protein [Agyrium rufum]
MAAHESIRDDENDEEAMLDANEAEEVVPDDDDPDVHMESDADDDADIDAQGEQEIQLQNDSIAHFDHHSDSIFCIANHPRNPSIIATGGGDDTVYVFSTASIPQPLLPTSYESNPLASGSRSSLAPIAKLSGTHTDSVNAIAFSLPDGKYLTTGGLDGRLCIYTSNSTPPYKLLSSAQEVPEINFLTACPHPSYANTFALGASDGSVWIYTIDPEADPSTPLQMQQAYYLHTASCTAGAWTPDGKLLATVSEDGSLYVWDPWGEAAAAGAMSSGPGAAASSGGQAVIGLTGEDQRFEIEGGLYSVAVSPSGATVVVGGANGVLKVVGLPILSVGASTGQQPGKAAKTAGSLGKPLSKKASKSAPGATSQAGQILASLQAQSQSIESLSFSVGSVGLLAAGSVEGNIAVFDFAHNFALKRLIGEAHEEFAVVRVEFGKSRGHEWELTSCGMDGVVRRWDIRGGGGRLPPTASPVPGSAPVTTGGGSGLMKEWKGHRGEGEGGGVLGFVVYDDGEGERLVTAGDDGVSLVFAA